MKMQRHLPPTAAPLAFQDLVTGALGLVCAGSFQRTLESEIKTFFDVKHVFLLTSGKAALTTILRGLKADSSRRQVIIPAYTCFSVPSAVLKAGLEVVLCDVDSHTLDLNLQRLRETVGPDTLAIVVPHLLGQPADIPAIRGIAEPVGALIIEDAAQAMGCKSEGRWLGTQGDIGFFSVGRGKNLSAGSGGVIVTNSDRLAESVRREYASLASEPIMAIIGNLLKVVVATFLIHPKLYWIPAGIPFLGLGETKFYSDFPVCRMDGIRVGLLSSWRGRLVESNRCRVQTRRSFLDRLSRAAVRFLVHPSEAVLNLRLPVLMPTAQQKEALCAAAKINGLGISGLYPAPISKISDIAAMFGTRRYPGAEALSARLVTLPLHRFVTETDVDRICAVVGQYVEESGEIPAQDCRSHDNILHRKAFPSAR